MHMYYVFNYEFALYYYYISLIDLQPYMSLICNNAAADVCNSGKCLLDHDKLSDSSNQRNMTI